MSLTEKKLLKQLSATSQDVEYGTPAMAEEIARLFVSGQVQQPKIIISGHPEGIISFDSTVVRPQSSIFNINKQNLHIFGALKNQG